MITQRMFLRRSVVSVALAGSLLALSVPVLSQPADGPAPTQDAATRQAHMRERVQAGLQRMAERLQLDASQQDAWAAYTKTVEGLVGGGWSKPPADADAAGLLRFRAERAAEHAQKLTQLAQATAALQEALNPEQRKVLDEMARQRGHTRHGAHKGHHKHAPAR